MNVVLPKSLTAGTQANAGDVMANFNKIVEVLNGKIDVDNLAVAIRNGFFSPGDLKPTGVSAAPEGWLVCEGQAVSRVTYAALFAAIGTTYGAGNGSTTFNLPDLRGRVPVGVDNGAGRLDGAWAPRNLGQVGGSMWLQTHAHFLSAGTSIESATHAHEIGFNNLGFHASLNWAAGGSFDPVVGNAGNDVTYPEGANHTHAINAWTNSEGLGNGQNMPPYAIVTWMVKT